MGGPIPPWVSQSGQIDVAASAKGWRKAAAGAGQADFTAPSSSCPDAAALCCCMAGPVSEGTERIPSEPIPLGKMDPILLGKR